MFFRKADIIKDVVRELALPAIQDFIPILPRHLGGPTGPIDGAAQFHRDAWARIRNQAGKGSAGAAEGAHDGPVAGSKHAGERLFVDAARHDRLAWMSVQPDTSEPGGRQASVDALVKKVCHADISESHAHRRDILWYGYELAHVQEIMGGRNPEAAYFSVSGVAEVLKFQPCERRESWKFLGLSRRP